MLDGNLSAVNDAVLKTTQLSQVNQQPVAACAQLFTASLFEPL